MSRVKQILVIQDGTRESTQSWSEVLLKDPKALRAFHDSPARHWQSIRMINSIESTFATIRHRTTCSKGCLSPDTMQPMMFKPGLCAEKRWRKLRGQVSGVVEISPCTQITNVKCLNTIDSAIVDVTTFQHALVSHLHTIGRLIRGFLAHAQLGVNCA